MNTTKTTATQPTIYARHETTNDSATREMYKAQGTPDEPLPMDVVLYANEDATGFMGRIPWFYSSKPTRRNKWQMLNCYRYRLQWID